MASRARVVAGGLTLVLAAMSLVASASAQGPTAVHVSVPDCETLPFDPNVYSEVLRVELASHDIAVRPANEMADGRIAIDQSACGLDSVDVALAVSRQDTEQQASRRVVFTVKGTERRARVLALAAAEFLTLKWRGLGTPAKPKPERVDAATLAALEARLVAQHAREMAQLRDALNARTKDRSSVHPQWWLGVGPRLDLFPEYGSAVAGPSLWISGGIGRHIRIRGELYGGLGRANVEQGIVRIRTVAASASALFGGGRNAWVGIGPRAELGWARLRGTAFQDVTLVIARSVAELTGSVGVHVVAQVPFHDRWGVHIDAVVGFGLVRVDGVSVDAVRTGVGGTTATLSMGIAHAFR